MHLLGQLPDYKVVKAVPVIVLDGDVPKEPKNSKSTFVPSLNQFTSLITTKKK